MVSVTESDRSYLFSSELMKFGRELTAKQLIVLDLLLQGVSKEEAAKQADVGVSSIWRWLKRGSVFEEAFTLSKADIWEAALWRVKRMTGLALDTLEDTLESKNERLRLRAAELILKYSLPTSSVRRVEDGDHALGRKWSQLRDEKEKQRYFRPEHYRDHEFEIAGRTKKGRMKFDRSEFHKNEAAYKKLANGQV